MITYLLACALGIISGGITAALFIHSTSQLLQRLSCFVPTFGAALVPWAIHTAHPSAEIDHTEPAQALIFVFLIFWIIGSLLFSAYSINSYKDCRITLMHILTGKHRDLVNTSKLKNDRKDLEEDRSQLEKKEQELHELRTNLENQRTAIELQKSDAMLLNIVGSPTIPVTREHLDYSPEFVRSLCQFYHAINQILEQQEKSPSFNRLVDEKNTHSREAWIPQFQRHCIASLDAICYYINYYLFQNSDTIRYHFRVRGDDGDYHSFFAVHRRDQSQYPSPVTAIPYDSLIRESYEKGAALLYSLNPDTAHPLKDDKFHDFLTYAFPEILDEDKPVITMGLSFEEPKRYNLPLHLFLHYNFEKAIRDILLSFLRSLSNDADLPRLLKSFYQNHQ